MGFGWRPVGSTRKRREDRQTVLAGWLRCPALGSGAGCGRTATKGRCASSGAGPASSGPGRQRAEGAAARRTVRQESRSSTAPATRDAGATGPPPMNSRGRSPAGVKPAQMGRYSSSERAHEPHRVQSETGCSGLLDNHRRPLESQEPPGQRTTALGHPHRHHPAGDLRRHRCLLDAGRLLGRGPRHDRRTRLTQGPGLDGAGGRLPPRRLPQTAGSTRLASHRARSGRRADTA
jgi:hypothetical protein